jgi:hypothetical protein
LVSHGGEAVPVAKYPDLSVSRFVGKQQEKPPKNNTFRANTGATLRRVFSLRGAHE